MADYISREAALSCFHDWIDQRGDVHEADEIPEYQAIEALPAADVVPWAWLEKYADNFNATLTMSEFIREARMMWEADNG